MLPDEFTARVVITVEGAGHLDGEYPVSVDFSRINGSYFHFMGSSGIVLEDRAGYYYAGASGILSESEAAKL